MRRAAYVLLGTIVVLPALAGVVQAADIPDIFLTEVQTSSESSGTQEFIELYNNTDEDIDFADMANNGQSVWQLQYFSSTKVTQSDFDWTSTSPSGVITLTGSIAAHDYYVLSTNINGAIYSPDGIEPDQTYSSARLANTAGGLQLIDSTQQIVTAHDQIGWSDADPPANDLMMPPQPGGSLQRMVDDQDSYTDANNNLYPWAPTSTISPADVWRQPPAEDETDPPSDDSETPDPFSGPETLEITELFPNPASPLTDTADEFVEIYNYGGVAVDLHDFTIQTGTTYAYSYTIQEGTVASHQYIALSSGDTSLALSNSGGQARLLDPNGQVIDETAAYEEASEGEAWALFGDTWQWTTSPTPGAANVLHLPIIKTKSQKVKKPKTKKKKAKKSKTFSGVLGTNDASGGGTPSNDQPPFLHPAVLAGVGGAALLYGAYEYRTDLANRLYQLKRYRAARRAARAAAKGA